MERILDCTSCAWNSFNSRTAFSIKHFPKVFFSWECWSTWRQTTPTCGLRRIGKCKHTAVWQWPLTPGPWDHTHGRVTVCLRWMLDVPFKVLKSPWIRAKSTRRSDLPTYNRALCFQFVRMIAVEILFYVRIVILSLFPPECLSVAISSFLYKSQPTGVGSNTRS